MKFETKALFPPTSCLSFRTNPPLSPKKQAVTNLRIDLQGEAMLDEVVCGGTLGFAHAKGLIRGLNRYPNPSRIVATAMYYLT
jgi:hypothetical protein